MAQVHFLLSDVPFERGEVAELPEAEAENKFYDGVVEFVDGGGEVVDAESEPEEVEEFEAAGA